MAAVTPEELVRSEIRALKAYHVPDAKGLIKLDAMENPYGWPKDLKTLWLEQLRSVALNRYPDSNTASLKACLREFMAVTPAAQLILGNGSDELIQLVMLALLGPGRVVLAPEPSFVMYRMIANFVGMDFVGISLRDDDFNLDMSAMLEAIERYRPVVIFLAYPNNPTGNRFKESEVHRIITATPGLVVVDEAYFAFAEHSFLTSLSSYDNLLIMRTLSKMGLAGLRLGLLIGPPAWLNEIEKLRLPYNINVLTQVSAEFILRHPVLLNEQCQRIRANRTALMESLRGLPGITPFPSEANFILFRTPAGEARRLFTTLCEGGILVKDLSSTGGLLRDCLRVTVGTSAENRAFLAALAAAL
jgi:histidinol-phosphate aminotransferase